MPESSPERMTLEQFNEKARALQIRIESIQLELAHAVAERELLFSLPLKSFDLEDGSGSPALQ